MKPDDNYGRKCYANDEDISKDRLLGIVPPFMKAESQLNNLYCKFKELSSKFFDHQNIKGRLALYPKSLIKRFEDKISGLADEIEKIVTKQCEDISAKLLDHFLQFSKDVDVHVQELLGKDRKLEVVEKTLEKNIKALLKLAETKREEYFKTMNNDYIEGLLRGLSSSEPQDAAAEGNVTHEDLSSTNPSFEYKEFKFRSVKTTTLGTGNKTTLKDMEEGPVNQTVPNEEEEVSKFNQQQDDSLSDNEDEDDGLQQATIELNEDMNIAGLDNCGSIVSIVNIDIDNMHLIDNRTNRFDINVNTKQSTALPACSWRTCKSCNQQRNVLMIVDIIRFMLSFNDQLTVVGMEWYYSLTVVMINAVMIIVSG